MTSVFIGNLSDKARNDDIHDFFKGYGKLTDISLKVIDHYKLRISFLNFRAVMGLLSLSVATMLETRAKISTVVDCVINGLELKYRRAEEIVVAAETVAGTAVVEAGHVVEDLEACQTTYVPETV